MARIRQARYKPKDHFLYPAKITQHLVRANQSAPPREKLESDEKSHADHDSEEIKGRAPELTELQPPSIHFFFVSFKHILIPLEISDSRTFMSL